MRRGGGCAGLISSRARANNRSRPASQLSRRRSRSDFLALAALARAVAASLHAPFFRVGFVNSIARICRQIQRSGGGARPPRQRAGHRRQTAVAAVCATERRRRQARQRHLGSSDPVPQTNGAARGRPSPATRALSLFRPRWSDRSARDGRLFAARERDIASKVAAGARSTAIVIARFPPGVHSRSPARPTPFARASTGRPSTSWSTGGA